jgi:DNA transposition AAA+ family ATPase
MNDPAKQPIDIEEQRMWLMDHRTATGFTWSEIAKRIGVKVGTISQFGSEKGYAGDEARIADAVFRYRQQIAQLATLGTALPEKPGYFETPSSLQLMGLLHYAKEFGRIVLGATGAGVGKSETAKHLQVCFPNVFHAEMSPSSAGVNTMQLELLRVMGDRTSKGTPQALTWRIRDLLRGLGKPLIIIDEAQHLSQKAIDEIRGWNDKTGVGIAFLGNIEVLKQIDGSSKDNAFAQLSSRVAMRMKRAIPLRADAIALAHAWKIFDDDLVEQIVRISLHPGGLRGTTYTLESAFMTASSEGRMITVDDIQSAWAQRRAHGGAA